MTALVVRADEPVTPEGAVAIALAENRDLAAARFAIREAEGRLSQVGVRPNPEVELRQANDVLFGNEGEYNLSLGFKQRFPITGRLAKAKAVARVDVARAAAEVRNQERLVAGEVLGRARELLVIQQKIRTNEKIQDSIRALIDVSERRLQAAEVSAADVNAAKLALQQVVLAQAELLSQRDAGTATLNALLGRDPDALLNLSGSLSTQYLVTDSADAVRVAISRRPDRQLVALGIDRAEAETALARAEKWEDVTVGLDYGRDYARFIPPVGGKLDNSIGVSVSVPLPLWNKNQGRLSEVQATRQRALAEMRALELQISAEIKNAEKRQIRLAAVLDSYANETTNLANDNLALVQQGYANGLLAVTAVIQAQQQLTALRQSYLDTLGEFLKAKTEWETATATLPYDQTHSR